MFSVFEHSCGSPPEPEKITLKSNQASVEAIGDPEMELALKAVEKTADYTANLIVDILTSVIQVRKSLGEWRAEIERWAEQKVSNYTLTVALASTDLALMDADCQNLYFALKDSVDTQLEVLDLAFKTECRSLKGALRSQCEDEQKDCIGAAREEMGFVLPEAAEKLGQLKKKGEELSKTFTRVKAMSDNYENTIRDHINDKDGWLEAKIAMLREEAYLSCLASVACGPAAPVCAAACVGTAAGVVEGEKVPAMKQALQETKDALNKLAASFHSLSQKTEGLKTTCGNRVSDMGKAATSIKSTMHRINNITNIDRWKRLVPIKLHHLSRVLQQNMDHLKNGMP